MVSPEMHDFHSDLSPHFWRYEAVSLVVEPEKTYEGKVLGKGCLFLRVRPVYQKEVAMFVSPPTASVFLVAWLPFREPD